MNNYLRRLECCLVMSDNDRGVITKPTSPAANQMSWVLLMLFVDARIYQATEHILSHCRNNAEIYWGNGKWNQINWSFCDNISDIFSIYQIDKADNSCCWPHKLSTFLMLFLDASIDQGSERILSDCRKDPVIYWGNCQAETNQLIHLW